MGEYSKSNIILANRKHLKMTRAELSEGICDELTLLRYEKGLIDPTDEKFYNLMLKMGQRGDCYIIPYTQENIYYITLQKKIAISLQKNNLDTCLSYLNELLACESFDLSIPENKQYVERLQYIIKYQKKEINANEFIDHLIKILKYTFTDFNEKSFPAYRIFSENELLIINNIATTYGQIGELEKSYALFDMFISYFKKNSRNELVKPLYKLFVNYSNILGQNKCYEQSIEICQIAIEWLMKRDCQNLLYNFYFNIGWIYSEYAKFKKEPNVYHKKAKAYVWLSYVLCSFYPESASSKEKILAFYNSLTKAEV